MSQSACLYSCLSVLYELYYRRHEGKQGELGMTWHYEVNHAVAVESCVLSGVVVVSLYTFYTKHTQSWYVMAI
jgi:hypothetical protein